MRPPLIGTRTPLDRLRWAATLSTTLLVAVWESARAVVLLPGSWVESAVTIGLAFLLANFASVTVTRLLTGLQVVKGQVAQLSILQEAAMAAARLSDFGEILRVIVEQLHETLGFSNVQVWLLDEKGHQLVIAANVGYPVPATIKPKLGEGITGWVALHRESQNVPDVSKDPRYICGDERVRSELAVLLEVGHRLIGVLNVEHHELNAFSEDDVRLLSALASQISIAIESARLRDEERKRTEELSILLDTAQTLVSSLDLEQLLEIIARQAKELTSADGSRIYLLEPDEEALKAFVVLEDCAEEIMATPVPIGYGITGHVAATGIAEIVNHAERDPRAVQIPGTPEEAQCLMCAPLMAKGKVIGVMTLSREREKEFEDSHLRLLTSVASQAATAIENARLYQMAQQELVERKRAQEAQRESEAEARKRLEEQITLREAMAVISSSLDLQTVLTRIAEQMSLSIHSTSAYISSFEPETKTSAALSEYVGPDACPRELVSDFGETYEEVDRGFLAALQANQPQVNHVDDPDLPEEDRAYMLQYGARSILYIPLWIRQELIGYAEVWESRRRREFTLEEIALCRGIAQSAAIAIENARLYEETQKRLSETMVLHKVAEIINATLDLNEVSERVVGELSETFGYRLVDICLLEEGGLRLQAQVGYDAETIIDFIPLERGVIGRVARTGEPAFITDVGQDPDYISSYPDITSEICVPIMSGKTLLGTLNVECAEKRPLSNDDLQLLFILSSHIGVAIENARFYEEEQRRSTQRNTIAEVGRSAAAILEMDVLLPQVVDLIAQNFGYYRVHIFQMERNSEYAVYKAGTGKAGLAIAEEGLRLKVGEEGLVGWVARHGEPLLVNDVSQDPRYYSHPELPDTRSELDVPIRVAGRIIGVLDVQSTELNAFDESDVDTLQTLADQLAVAMENARLYQETERLAITDSLTGLHNLRYFYETLEKEIRRSERYHHSVSVIILDIDEFKAYNDLYGHLAGDDVLRELAQLMSKVTRQTDTLARYGGEEFTIILPETEIGGARFVAERLLEEVREHRFSMQDGQTTGRITISLGVATYPHHADDATALVDAADNALLQAKREGKDRVCVHEPSAA